MLANYYKNWYSCTIDKGGVTIYDKSIQTGSRD